jgi:catechol 2,3-dioxygenase-like lactoylglutathione lyase family enzyme
MTVKYCMPVIPSDDLQKSLRFWTEGLGFTADRQMEIDGKLVGCMVHHEAMFFWLNRRADEPKPETYTGISLYWTPVDIKKAHQRLKNMGYDVSDIMDRDYGQTEFFMTDDDGYPHCFGVDTKEI